MSIELGRRLIAGGAVHPSEIEAGFFRQLTAQIPFVRAMLELGHLTDEALEQELANSPVPFLATIIPLPALVDELPNQMCRRLMAIPVRRDPRTGLVDVAAVDPFDAHIPYEFSFHLKSEVRVLRGPLAAIERALARIDRGEYSASVILRKSVRPPGYGSPSAPPLRSDRPIPLVRKSKRGQSIEVHPVRDISGPPGDRPSRADVRSHDVPPAPSVPSFSGRPPSAPRSRQQTAPGPPGVPSRQAPPQPPPAPPAPLSARSRPEVPSGAPSARSRPEVPSVAPGRGRPEVPSSASIGPSPPAVASGPPPSRGRPEVPATAIGRIELAARPPPAPKIVPGPGGSTAARTASGTPTASGGSTPVGASSASGAAAASKGRAEPAPTARKAGSVPPPKGSATRSRASGPPPPPKVVPTTSKAAASTSSASTGARARTEPAASQRAPQGGKARTSSSPPATTRGPFSPKAPAAPFADIRGVLAAMESATTRDDVIDCLIVGMSTVGRRVGVFAVKKGCYKGVACNAELGDAARFRNIEIPSEATTVLGIAATSGSYLGPLPVTPPHQDLLAFMKNVSTEVAATLIRVAGRPAVILFADGLADTTLATRRAEELGHEASLALSRIVTDAKAGRGRA